MRRLNDQLTIARTRPPDSLIDSRQSRLRQAAALQHLADSAARPRHTELMLVILLALKREGCRHAAPGLCYIVRRSYIDGGTDPKLPLRTFDQRVELEYFAVVDA